MSRGARGYCVRQTGALVGVEAYHEPRRYLLVVSVEALEPEVLEAWIADASTRYARLRVDAGEMLDELALSFPRAAGVAVQPVRPSAS